MYSIECSAEMYIVLISILCKLYHFISLSKIAPSLQKSLAFAIEMIFFYTQMPLSLSKVTSGTNEQ